MTGAPVTSSAAKKLELFNEKADQLLGSAFFSQAPGAGAIVEFKRNSGWDSVYVGPEDESTKALVLTLRLFMQDRDELSLRKMAETYSTLPVAAHLRREFETHRARLNDFLDSASRLTISEDGPLTYREILDIFMYGEYAHVGACRQTYEDLRTTPFFPLFQNCLVDAVVAFARCIEAVRRVNRDALGELHAYPRS